MQFFFYCFIWLFWCITVMHRYPPNGNHAEISRSCWHRTSSDHWQDNLKMTSSGLMTAKSKITGMFLCWFLLDIYRELCIYYTHTVIYLLCSMTRVTILPSCAVNSEIVCVLSVGSLWIYLTSICSVTSCVDVETPARFCRKTLNKLASNQFCTTLI